MLCPCVVASFPCRFCPKAGKCRFGIPEMLIDALNNYPEVVQPIHARYNLFSQDPYVLQREAPPTAWCPNHFAVPVNLGDDELTCPYCGSPAFDDELEYNAYMKG